MDDFVPSYAAESFSDFQCISLFLKHFAVQHQILASDVLGFVDKLHKVLPCTCISILLGYGYASNSACVLKTLRGPDKVTKTLIANVLCNPSMFHKPISIEALGGLLLHLTFADHGTPPTVVE